RLYRFDSDILTQGWWGALESGENLGASAHVPGPGRGRRRNGHLSKSWAMDREFLLSGPTRSTRWLSRHLVARGTRRDEAPRCEKLPRRQRLTNHDACNQSARIGAVRAPLHAFMRSGLMRVLYTPHSWMSCLNASPAPNDRA